MIKKLSDKGVAHYRPYKGVSLTGHGQQIALTLIRKHRLWEVFLVNTLDFSWDEVHEVAEQLEHIKSGKLVDRLDKFLGYPQTDPHGDPIPSKDGEFKKAVKKLLHELPVDSTGICVGVKDSTAPFLKFLDKNGIALGDTISVLEREEFDGSLRISVNDRELRISHQIATNLYLKIIT